MTAAVDEWVERVAQDVERIVDRVCEHGYVVEDEWRGDIRAALAAAGGALSEQSERHLKQELASPPPGWFTFGTHVDRDVELEFWGEGEDGLPIWERPTEQDREGLMEVILGVTTGVDPFVDARRIALAILKAGYGRPAPALPQTVETVDELEALPAGSVIRDSHGALGEVWLDDDGGARRWRFSAGTPRSTGVSLPATVLIRATQPTAKTAPSSSRSWRGKAVKTQTEAPLSVVKDYIDQQKRPD